MEYVYLEGMLLMRSGRFSAAKTQLGKALTLDPGLGVAHELLGMIAMAEGRFEDAVASFRAAIAAGEDDPEVRERLAQALAALERDEENADGLDEARQQLQR